MIRHSEAKRASYDGLDSERELTEKGSQDSLKMKAWLNGLSQQPEWFWVSPAKRALKTAQILSENTDAHLIIENTLYLATAYQLLDVIRSSPEETKNLAIVAHNPGISDLANSLNYAEKYHVLPTSGIAYFQVDCEWVEIIQNKQYSVDLVLVESPSAEFN